MSERVNRIVFTRKDCGDDDMMYDRVFKQIRLLVENGYSCFISDIDPKGGVICIEYALTADPNLDLETMPHPCWLYLDELAYLSKYQAHVELKEAKETVEQLEKELYDDFPSNPKDNGSNNNQA